VDNNEEHTCYIGFQLFKAFKSNAKIALYQYPNEEFDIYLMHSSIKEEELEDLDRFIEAEAAD